MNETAVRLMSRNELARMFSVTVRTLELWEKQNFGPKPVRLGRSVRYNSADVAAFMATLKAAS